MRVLILAALLGGCYNPTAGNCQFTCMDNSACPDGTTCSGGFCRIGDACAALDIAPRTFTVPIGHRQVFVAQAPRAAVTWSVIEPAGGTIDDSGVYTAPTTPGTYRVAATDGIGAGTATVNVVGLALSVAAGQLGGKGSGDGTGKAARFDAPSLIAVDGQGNAFVSDLDNATIRTIVLATGETTTLAGEPGVTGSNDGIGTAAHFQQPVGLAYDPGSKALYVSDSLDNTIRRIDVATGTVTTLAGSHGTYGTTNGANALFDFPMGLAMCDFNLYVADYNNNAIRAINTITKTTSLVASSVGRPRGIACGAQNSTTTNRIWVTRGNQIDALLLDQGAIESTLSGSSSAGNVDGSAASSTFSSPWGLAFDATNGRLIVADVGNGRIRAVEIGTGASSPVVGSTTVPCGSTDGVAATFCGPSGVALSSIQLVIADTQNDLIRLVTGATTSTVAGTVAHYGHTATMLDRPVGIETDAAGHVYVGDDTTLSTLAGGTLTRIAGSPGVSNPPSDGTGTAAVFSGVNGFAIDSAGSFWVPDVGAIRKVTPAGVVTTLYGQLGSTADVDQSGLMARFSQAFGIAATDTMLYVADTGNSSIRAIDLATTAVSTLAGSTIGTAGGDDGTGHSAGFDHPLGIASDGAGHLLVADTGNATIRVVDIATGAVTTLAGTKKSVGCTDAIGAAARFGAPAAIMVASDGSLFVVDRGCRSIRHIVVATGAVSTYAGQPASGAGVIVGDGASARFNDPIGIAAGANGALLITDRNENTVLSLEGQ